VQANEKTVRWLYDQHLAGLVGDTVAFEAWPPKFTDGWCLHEWLLVHWGMFEAWRTFKNDILTSNRYADWRDVGLGDAEREVPRAEAVYFLHDQRAAACEGWYRIATWRYCYLLVVREYYGSTVNSVEMKRFAMYLSLLSYPRVTDVVKIASIY